MAPLDNAAGHHRCLRSCLAAITGLGPHAESTSSGKGVWAIQPATNWCLPSWLLPQTNRAGTPGWESASTLEAWCPIAGQRRDPIAELGPEKPEGHRGGHPLLGPPTWSACQGLEINSEGNALTRPKRLVRAFLKASPAFELLNHRAGNQHRLGGQAGENGPAAAAP